jgi:hypothetical protein
MGKYAEVRDERLLFSYEQKKRWWWHLVELQDEVEEATGNIVPCKNAPDLFFPDNGERVFSDSQLARDACNRCPLQDACATYAVLANEKDGLWGGLSAIERRDLRKEIITSGKQMDFIKSGYFAYRKHRLLETRKPA